MTERTYEAHISRLVPRTNSADKEVASTGSKEKKSQESRSKAPETNQGNYCAAHPRQDALESVRLTQVAT